MKPELQRQVFTTSRELEYFSEAELVTQTGYAKRDWWPRALVKELLDNSLDACEQVNVAPEVQVSLSGGELLVADNGPGIPADVVARITDFSTRTSDKSAYVSPTRGAQGNALKTVLAMPYVLNSGAPATVEIQALGVHHVITVTTDHIARRPHIEHRTTEIVKTSGTSIRLRRSSPSSQTDERDRQFLQKLVLGYALFNPHATFALGVDGQEQRFPATASDWGKWRPSDPTPAHWYSLERFENLVASYIAAERTGTKPRTVREFVSEFRGLSSTARQKQVVGHANLDRAYLHDLLGEGRQLDRSALQRLLFSMQQASAPVKPDSLGVLGEAHFRKLLESDGDEASFRYKRLAGITEEGLPYVAEGAFTMTAHPLYGGAHVGLNWSVPLNNPLQETHFQLEEHGSEWGLWALLARNRIDLDNDPVCLALHLICPQFHFLDRGKARISLPAPFAAAVGKVVLDVTKEWAAIKKKQERHHIQASRMVERYRRAASVRITVKQAAYQVIADAYRKASGEGTYPANARQIMYAARPAIQELTGQALSDSYFTQTLLPDFMNEHLEETADWDIVYDARGHLWEPHTSQEVAIGTLGVREYLAEMSDRAPDIGLRVPQLPTRFPTCGPANRYGAILYIEKEGFLPLLQQARFAERYDLGIMSSKGMGTTAVRTLIERLHENVVILVLHDFDKSGFSISGTLTRDTRRYKFSAEPQVIDLGLRLQDVEAWNLQAEDVVHNGDPTENLRLNGASSEEMEFLRGERVRGSRQYKGRRVELNAFTSEEFVNWLESKLQEHHIHKVIPDSATLQGAYRRAAGIRKYQAVITEALQEVENYLRGLQIPEDIRELINLELAINDSAPWDQVIEQLVAQNHTGPRRRNR